MIVNRRPANGQTSTAVGPGLEYVAVGFPTHFVVTARDAYDNVLVHRKYNVTVIVDGQAGSNVTVFDS